MRMLPVVSVMGRATDKVMKVGPYTVPSGTIVATPLFAIHNTKHNWDAPEEFRPERWADVPVETYVYDSKAAEHGGKRGITFMPFRWVWGVFFVEGLVGIGVGGGAGAWAAASVLTSSDADDARPPASYSMPSRAARARATASARAWPRWR
jgi:hypothetical protein